MGSFLNTVAAREHQQGPAMECCEANVQDCGDSVLGVTSTRSSVSATHTPKKDMFFVRQTQEEEKHLNKLNCALISFLDVKNKARFVISLKKDEKKSLFVRA